MKKIGPSSLVQCFGALTVNKFSLMHKLMLLLPHCTESSLFSGSLLLQEEGKSQGAVLSAGHLGLWVGD